MATLDLDAARIARAEASGEEHIVLLGGQKFRLPPEVPARAGIWFSEGKLEEALAELFGDQIEDFWSHLPSGPDLEVFTDGLFELYGVDRGELPASGSSSPKTGKRSRPTSSGSTGSTSGSSSTANNKSGSAA